MNAIVTGGRYEILAHLGSGGMSQVYLAKDLRLHVKRTIKRINAGGGPKSYLSASVIAEANVLRKVRHPALPAIVDIFREGEHINLVMEYIEGRTLEETALLKPLTTRALTDIALEICLALKCLHSMKPPIIYRDMKPSNIMVREDGHICLIDFGTARRFFKGSARKDTNMLGTPAFAAPEQFGGRTDERSDIYSLGMTIRACAPGGKLKGSLKRIMDKCAQHDPNDRYKNVDEVIRDLRYARHKGLRLAIAAGMVLVVLTCARFIGLSLERTDSSISGAPDTTDTRDEYHIHLQSGNEAYLNMDYALAESEYTKAVTDTEPEDNTAYLRLLKLYKMTGLTGEGLDRLDELIPESGCRAGEGELCYECALTAFYDLKDYERALGYLAKVDGESYPEKAYFTRLIELFNCLDPDMGQAARVLKDFKGYNLTLPMGEQRLKNDLGLARLYLTYAQELEKEREDPLNHAKELAKEALTLTMSEDRDDLSRVQALNMLSTIYRLLGNKYEDNKDQYYDQAIDYTRQYLKESEFYENDGEKRMKYLNMARMYEHMDRLKEAIECYSESEELFPFQGADIYSGHLRCLYETGAGKEEMKKLLKEASRVEDIDRNPDYIRIKDKIDSMEG